MRGISPGPGGELVDDVVACEDKFFGGDLACVAESRGVRYWGPAISESREGGVEDVHSEGNVKNDN